MMKDVNKVACHVYLMAIINELIEWKKRDSVFIVEIC